MKLRIEINLDAESTSNSETGDHEIARILRDAGDRIVTHGYSARSIPILHDINGNTIGRIEVIED